MNKEKKREHTIEQLEKRVKITKKIAIYTYITVLLGSIGIIVILSIISVVTGITFSEYCVFPRYLLFVLFLLSIGYISNILSIKYENKIRDITKVDKVNIVKQMAEQGNIKEKVILKNEMLQNAILSNNIDKVVFKEIKCETVIPKDTDCTIELYLKDGTSLQTVFSMEDFLKLINRASKDGMLNHLIKSIQIENSEVAINAENFSYKGKVTDDKLGEMFEVKE